MTEAGNPPDLHRTMRVVGILFLIFTLTMSVLVLGIWQDGQDRDAVVDELRDGLEQVKDALAQFEADRIDRSVNACEDRNAIRVGVNSLALTGAGHDENGQPTEAFTSASPERQESARRFLEKLIPLQVCTPEGIQLYIDSDRTEGVVPIDGSDGYSEAVTPP